jgi:hypothetical protein
VRDPLADIVQFGRLLAAELAEKTRQCERIATDEVSLRETLVEANASLRSTSEALQMARSRIEQIEIDRASLIERESASALQQAELAEKLGVALRRNEERQHEVDFLRRRLSHLELNVIANEEKLAIQDRLLQSKAIRLVIACHTILLGHVRFLKGLARRGSATLVRWK